MKYLLIILLLIGCSTEKQCQRHLRKAEVLGCFKAIDSVRVIHDTTSKEVGLNDSVKPIIERHIIDSLRIKDTCFNDDRVNTIVNNLKIKPIEKSDSNFNLKIWIENGKLKYSLNIKPCVSTTTEKIKVNTITKTVNKTPWYDYAIIGILFLTLVISVIKRK